MISGCPILAKEQYVKRHDKVCTHLHLNICKETGVHLDKKHWYEHVPKPLEMSQEGRVTILWNQQVQTDTTILSNTQDILIRGNEKEHTFNRCNFRPRNVIKKEAEKTKNIDLTIEIQHMWNVKTKVRPLIIGVTDCFKVIQKICEQHTRKP